MECRGGLLKVPVLVETCGAGEGERHENLQLDDDVPAQLMSLILQEVCDLFHEVFDERPPLRKKGGVQPVPDNE